MVHRSIRCIIALFLLVVAFPTTSAPAIAQTTGGSIRSLAVNPATNRIYASFDNSIVVIDGASNAVIATISGTSGHVAVNPTTNRIYVAQPGSTGGSLLSVIDGTSNTVVATIPVAEGPLGQPSGVATNPATNRIYVTHFGEGTSGGTLMSVLDGASIDNIAKFYVSGNVPRAAPQVNPTTNRIYVGDGSLTFGNVVVVDGATNAIVATVSLAAGLNPPPTAVAVNPSTNRIYARDKVIDGATNTLVASIPILALAVNPSTNRIYGTPDGNSISVVDGASNTIQTTIPLGFKPSIVPVNPTTNRIYAASDSGTTVAVIDGASNTVISTISLPPPLTPHDARYFSPTGFRIDNDVFWDYFNKRGGIRTFGYPVSRTFPFLGFTTQFFQREIMQLGPDGAARTLNILDPGLMPYTTINGATFPGTDPSITAQAPVPGSPGYGSAVLSFVKAHAPDQFEGMNTNYYQTFANAVTFNEAFPGGDGDPNLLLGFDLEMWGVPTSNPARDTNNGNFIYQRFQRGVMHFDATNNVTQGLLLADYLKSILTGQNLPSDLDAQAKGSRFYKQYNPAKPNWLDRPNELPATDLTNAFQTE